MKKNIMITLSIIIIVFLGLGIYGFFIKNSSDKLSNNTLIINKDDEDILDDKVSLNRVTPGVIYCKKKVDNIFETYLYQVIEYDDTYAIKDYYYKFEYNLKNDDEYNTLRANTSDCNDSYVKDKKITCVLEKENNMDYIIGKWAKDIIDNLKENNFTCEVGERE